MSEQSPTRDRSIRLQLQDEASRDAHLVGDALLVEPFTYSRLLRLVQEIQASRPVTGRLAEAAAEGSRTAPTTLRGHILLVEDNHINQQVASRMLAKLGLTCDIARHGGEALRCLAERPYDLVLMDMEMPEMDGLEASRTIRANENASHARRIPIIAMTANAMTEDRARCLASGMDDYLAKPVELGALKHILGRWLDTPAGSTDID